MITVTRHAAIVAVCAVVASPILAETTSRSKPDGAEHAALEQPAVFDITAKSGSLVPSVAHGMAIAPATEGAIKDAVSQFWNDDKISVADAMKKIATAAKTK